jgi:hypothetical protein
MRWRAPYNAYLKSNDPVERGVALFVIGRDYDRHDKQKEALAAFEAGLTFTQSPSVAERAEQLRRLVAFRVTKVDVQAEAEWAALASGSTKTSRARATSPTAPLCAVNRRSTAS